MDPHRLQPPRSAIGEGSRFTLWLPAAEHEEASALAVPELAEHS